MSLFEKIPKPIIVFFGLLIPILFLVFANKPHSKCDSQIENFSKEFSKILNPIKIKNLPLPMNFKYSRDECVKYGTRGSCLNLFEMINRVIIEFENTEAICSNEFQQLNDLNSVLFQGAKLLTLAAWKFPREEKEKETNKFPSLPPDSSIEKTSWIEASDIFLFCRIKKVYSQINGAQSWVNLANGIMKDLPFEPKEFEVNLDSNEKICKNCETQKRAIEVMTLSEIQKKSLIGINCSN